MRTVMMAVKSQAQELVSNGTGMEALIKAQQLTEIIELIQSRQLLTVADVWSRISDIGEVAHIERLLDDNQRGVESLMKESKSLNYFLAKSTSRAKDGIKPTSMAPHLRYRGVGVSRHSRDMMASISEINTRDSLAIRLMPTINILQPNACSWIKKKNLSLNTNGKRSASLEKFQRKVYMLKKNTRARSLGINNFNESSLGCSIFKIPTDLDYSTLLRGTNREILPWTKILDK